MDSENKIETHHGEFMNIIQKLLGETMLAIGNYIGANKKVGGLPEI